MEPTLREEINQLREATRSFHSSLLQANRRHPLDRRAVRGSRAFERLIRESEDFQDELHEVEAKVANGRPQPNLKAYLLEDVRRVTRKLGDVLSLAHEVYSELPSKGPWRKTIKGHRDLIKTVERVSLPIESLSEQLQLLLDKAAMTTYSLSSKARVENAYTYRLVNGQRENPGPRVLNAIADALFEESPEITVADIRQLYRTLALEPPSHYAERETTESVGLLRRLVNRFN